MAFEVTEAEKDRAELVFTKGCLADWGENPWRLTRSLGLVKEEVCSYCRVSFWAWAEQLALHVHLDPHDDGSCRLRVVKS